jgi:hypothetical protein
MRRGGGIHAANLIRRHEKRAAGGEGGLAAARYGSIH